MDTSIEILLKPQYEFVKNLDKDTKETLRLYIEGYHNAVLNRYLMGRETSLPPLTKKLYITLARVFKEIEPVKTPFIVYRGARRNQISENIFVSTSSDKSLAEFFADDECCLFIINVSSGCKVLPMKNMNDIKTLDFEEEYLLNRGNRYIITHETVEARRKTIYVTVIPRESKSIEEESEDCIIS